MSVPKRTVPDLTALSAAATILLTIAAAPSLASPDLSRRFTVRDSIEMSEFTSETQTSPDGQYFVIATERGIVSENRTEGTIWLFETNAVREVIARGHASRTVTPVALARLSTSINGGGGPGHGSIITKLTWETGGRSLLFLGRDGRENRQLFRVTVSDHRLTALSLSTQDVVDYSYRGNHVAYLAGPDIAPEKAWWSNDPSAPDIVPEGRRSFWELLYPNCQTSARYMPTEFEVWQTGTTPAPVVDATTGKPM
jgi:hypothetical protein